MYGNVEYLYSVHVENFTRFSTEKRIDGFYNCNTHVQEGQYHSNINNTPLTYVTKQNSAVKY